MALAPNALTTRSSLQSYMRVPVQDSAMMAIYAVNYTTAYIEKTSTLFTITLNGLATSFAVGSINIQTLVNNLNAIEPSRIFARVLGGAGESDAVGLLSFKQTNILTDANEAFLRGIDYGAVDNAINAASTAFERYCGRSFAAIQRNEFYDGTGRPYLSLKNSPVISVDRVAIGRRNAITVSNSLTDNSDAVVSVADNQITLRVYGGTSAGTISISLVGAVLSQTASAISSAGSGWSASLVDPSVGQWSSTELLGRSPSSVKGGGSVVLFVPETTERHYVVGEDGWTLYRMSEARLPGGPWSYGYYDSYGTYSARSGTPYSHIAPLSDPGGRLWPVGQFNIYVSYTAGYSTIPPDLSMLCNEAAANILRSGARDMTLRSEFMQGYHWTSSSESKSDEVESWFTSSLKKRLKQFVNVIPSPRCMRA